MSDYKQLHAALDEAAYEILVNYRTKISNEIDKLEAEKSEIDDQIAKMELETAA